MPRDLSPSLYSGRENRQFSLPLRFVERTYRIPEQLRQPREIRARTKRRAKVKHIFITTDSTGLASRAREAGGKKKNTG